MKKELLRILVVDDSEDDTLLLERELKHGEWEITIFRVDTSEKMKRALKDNTWDVILSDYMIPGFGGMEALNLFKSFHLDLPFILISGKITEEMAVLALQEGAQDFVLKQNFARLLPAIRRGIERVHILSEKRKIYEDLQESETLFRTLASVAPIGIVRTDAQGKCLYGNKKWQEITGISEPCQLNTDSFLTSLHAEDRESFSLGVQSMIDTRSSHYSGELRHQKPDGSIVWVLGEIAPIFENDSIVGYIGTATDITAEKENEVRLIRQKELYQALSFTNQAIVYSTTEKELFDEICRIAIEQGKFTYCWITSINPSTQALELEAVGGGDESYVSDLKALLAQQGKFLLDRLQETSELIFNDIDDPEANLTICKELAKNYKNQSFANFRLGDETTVRGILTFCSNQKNFFDDEIQDLLREMVGDISFALNNFKEARWRRDAEDTLRENQLTIADMLIDTVSAIATTIEMRDPYTAGHQKRVSLLACAIAEKLGMEQYRIEGLRLASQIHDVGKIQIPAEILSKPTQLSDIEFLLIKVHPEAGYEIIKDINFPWPVATIVRQHHEKLDGSGYPHGLSGDELLLEARILTVADMVEAMASHRPYRPALGIEVALEEIQHEKGDKLDAAVVDACISLFRENAFSF